MIKFTLVTVTYNAADTFAPTAESVLRQSYADVEHIIIDGASTDDTLAMAEAYRQRSQQTAPRHEIIIVSEPDGGLYDAMQKGLNRATGDYVCFLNAGDRLPDDDTLLSIADKTDIENKPGVLYGDTLVVDAQGTVVGRRHLAPPEHLSWRSFRQGMLVCHQAFYVLTEVARQEPYDQQYRYSADVDWCIRVMKRCEQEQRQLVNLHAVVCHYLREGQTTLHHRASLRERFRIMVHHYGWPVTIVMHGWFALRSILRKLRQRDSSSS